MTTPYSIKIICATCNGTGINPSDDTPCQDCNQTGYELEGVIDGAEQIETIIKELDSIEKKVNKILKKLDISEKEEV